MAERKNTKDVKVGRCNVCRSMTLNEKCINRRCPMFQMSRMNRAVRVGLSAASQGGGVFDNMGAGRNTSWKRNRG